jgi:hypothetical protein
MSPKAKKSSTKGKHGEDLEYIPEPGEVVEGLVCWFDVVILCHWFAGDV